MTSTSNILPTDIPTPGTPAYWATQREGVALVDAYSAIEEPDPSEELERLRRIAAHGFAARIMAAQRKPVASWIMDLERTVAVIDRACFGTDGTLLHDLDPYGGYGRAEPLDPATVGARLPELATAIGRHRQEHAADLAAIRQRVQRNGNDEHDVPF